MTTEVELPSEPKLLSLALYDLCKRFEQPNAYLKSWNKYTSTYTVEHKGEKQGMNPPFPTSNPTHN
jgi:hypothetical protein